MILKKIAHKVAQAFRLAQAADKKLSTGIAAALDAKAEQLREYEKSFEPEPPEPDPLLEALKPEPLSHLTNNWQDENKALYEWDDLDGPRPTMDEYEKQEKEARE